MTCDRVIGFQSEMLSHFVGLDRLRSSARRSALLGCVRKCGFAFHDSCRDTNNKMKSLHSFLSFSSWFFLLETYPTCDAFVQVSLSSNGFYRHSVHHPIQQPICRMVGKEDTPCLDDENSVHDGLSSRRIVLVGSLLSTAGLLLSGANSASASMSIARTPYESSGTSPANNLSTERIQTPQVTTTSTSALIADSSVSAAAASTSPVAPVEWKAILEKASKKALGGGKAGASAAVVQVSTLMWLRTSMNYQYRYGGNLQSSLQTLWQEGGVGRLYQGLPFALVQGPLTRFGDTAANVGILAILQALPATQDWPLPLKTACGSAAAGLWRIVLMPVDASKTAMQVEGSMGLQRLWSSASTQGPGVLYRGALAQAAATAVGHFPWFLTFNFLDGVIPFVNSGDDNALVLGLARSAILGFSASCVSDCASNSLRVIKTTKQTAQLSGDGIKKDRELSYPEIVQMIIEKDGVVGLFGRGLQTRLLTNAIQGAMFSILWKYFQQANGV